MQAVILAAGKSTRTYPLTLTRPKPLLKVMNKPILEHLLDALCECSVNEAILIVGYKKDMVKDYFGDRFKNIKLTYAVQHEQLGTLHALHQVKDLIKDRFMVLYGDDLLHSSDLKKVLNYQYSLLVLETSTPERFGIVKVDSSGHLEDIIEKPKHYIGNLASVGGFVFDKKIFSYPLELEQGQTEYYIPSMLRKLCKDEVVVPVNVKEYWLPTGYPWDLLNANERLIKNFNTKKILGSLEDNVNVHGPVMVGKGTKILSGCYIDGPVIIGNGCSIGPNSYLRPGTTIGDNCSIGFSVEIKNSIIMDNAKIKHLSYIADSIIGDNVNIGALTVTANLRHDKEEIFSLHKDKLINTNRTKFGAVISDNVSTGVNTVIYPGRKIWPGLKTLPGEIVKKDIK